MLNDAVKKGGVMASSNVGGLSGAFIPVSEDAGMIDAAANGTLSLEKLEAMTSVCSVGLDMIVLPGDTPAETISAIIADEAAIGMVNSKTTAVRVIPAIGHREGEMLDFGGLLGRGPIMTVDVYKRQRQHCIEQQYSIIGPAFQISMRRRVYIEVALQLFKYVDERRRRLDAFLHRKTETMSLSRLMIRILSQYHYLHVLVRRELEGVEDVVHIRIYHSGTVFRLEELPQLQIIIFIKFSLQDLVPAVSYIDHTPIILTSGNKNK